MIHAYQQAKKGQQPDELLQQKVQEHGSAQQRNRLKAILGIARSNQQNQQKPPRQPSSTPAPRKTPNPRHLYLSRQVPPLHVAVRHQGQVVVYTELGKEWHLSENDPSLHGHDFLGHEGEKVRFAYHRTPTDQERAEFTQKETLQGIQHQQNQAFQRALHIVVNWVVGGQSTQSDPKDLVIWNNHKQHGHHWDNQQLSQRENALVFRHFRWEPFDEAWQETLHIRTTSSAPTEIQQALETLKALACEQGIFRSGQVLI